MSQTFFILMFVCFITGHAGLGLLFLVLGLFNM